MRNNSIRPLPLRFDEIDSLISFNNQMFPERGVSFVKRCICHWITKSNNAIESIIIIKDKDEIIGQDILSEILYYFEGNMCHGYFSLDLIVNDKYRGLGYGKKMLLFIKNKFPDVFATGVNPNSFAIYLKIGYHQNGTMRKYLGVCNFICLPLSIINKKRNIPYELKLCADCFRLLSVEELPEPTQPYNINLLEFGRDKNYLRWRFFNGFHQYYFYYSEMSNNYFVVRIIQKKHIHILLLVDFRCNLSNPNEFNDIMSAIKKFMKKTRLSFVICGSSNRFIDQVCEKHNMFSIGKPRLMIGPDFLKTYDDRINKREFSLITLADSDGELYL